MQLTIYNNVKKFKKKLRTLPLISLEQKYPKIVSNLQANTETQPWKIGDMITIGENIVHKINKWSPTWV